MKDRGFLNCPKRVLRTNLHSFNWKICQTVINSCFHILNMFLRTKQKDVCWSRVGWCGYKRMMSADPLPCYNGANRVVLNVSSLLRCPVGFSVHCFHMLHSSHMRATGAWDRTGAALNGHVPTLTLSPGLLAGTCVTLRPHGALNLSSTNGL